MATYAIGDIQGCYKTLKRLLKRISFNRKHDRIYLVGDLVNRGPDSLDVLRWASDHSGRVVSLLGNHDLHLIAIWLGVANGRKEKTLQKVLRARDCDELVEWLRERPLLARQGNVVFVHAGILPAWTVDEATLLAKQAEKIIRGKKAVDFFKKWYKIEASDWRNSLVDYERHSVVLNALTRMRMCHGLSEMDLSFTGKPEDAPKGVKPWYAMPGRKSADHTIIFGHWSALGLRVTPNTISLDTGCVWGGSLTAIRLEDGAIASEPY